MFCDVCGLVYLSFVSFLVASISVYFSTVHARALCAYVVCVLYACACEFRPEPSRRQCFGHQVVKPLRESRQVEPEVQHIFMNHSSGESNSSRSDYDSDGHWRASSGVHGRRWHMESEEEFYRMREGFFFHKNLQKSKGER